MRIANYAVIALVTLVSIWVVVSMCIVCIPLRAMWDPRVQGKCIPGSALYSNGVLHIVTDFIIFALPLPVLVKLNMRRKQKIGLLAVFALGFL